MLMTAFLAALAAGCAMLLLGRRLRRAAGAGGAVILQRTEADLAQLFIFVSSSRLRWAALVTVLVCLGACRLLGAPWLVCVIVAACTSMVPRLLVAFLRRRWRSRITAQLPDALAMWAGLLRAGQSMASSLAQLGSRQANPLGAELRLVLSQYRLGVALDVAMAQLRDRCAVPDLRMLATLLRAQRDLGGNLAEALDRLAATLRNRLAMEARIRSLTAQGRLQGVVVGALPLLLAAVLSLMEPAAMKTLVETPQGWAAIALILVLELAGFALIRRIVNIDV